MTEAAMVSSASWAELRMSAPGAPGRTIVRNLRTGESDALRKQESLDGSKYDPACARHDPGRMRARPARISQPTARRAERRHPSGFDGDPTKRLRGIQGLSASAEHGSHLEMADGKGRLLEQTGQLRLNDLCGPQRGAVVDDEDFFMAQRRHRLGSEPAANMLVNSTRYTVRGRYDHGTRMGHGNTRGVILRHLMCTLLEGTLFQNTDLLKPRIRQSEIATHAAVAPTLDPGRTDLPGQP